MKTLIINSADRILGTSDKFTVSLYPVDNARALKLRYFRAPNIIYNVTSTNNNLDFTYNSTQYTVTIPPGAYSTPNLTSAIASALNTAQNLSFTCSMGVSSFRTIITASSSVTFPFISGPHASTTLGGILGFTADISGTSVVSPNAPDLAVPYFIYINMPQFAPGGTDSAQRQFNFYVPVSADTGEFIEYCPKHAPEVCLSGSRLGIPGRLEVSVTSTSPNFSLASGNWSAAFEIIY